MAKQNSEKIKKAIDAVNTKRPIPEIDFTLHEMEDGSTVNTTERVVKGSLLLKYPLSLSPLLMSIVLDLYGV